MIPKFVAFMADRNGLLGYTDFWRLLTSMRGKKGWEIKSLSGSGKAT